MPSVLALTQSGFDPASRFRWMQFMPRLREAGWKVSHRPNRPDRQWHSPIRNLLLNRLHYRAGRVAMKLNRLRDVADASKFDVVFVNRDLAGGGLYLEKRLLRRNPRVVFDFDDAIFLGDNEPAVRWMCERAAHVTPGNRYLAQYAQRHSDRVTVLPTVVDTDAYWLRTDHEPLPGALPRVGWSGSTQSIESTLFPWLPVLAEIQKRHPFELVIVSNAPPKLPDSPVCWRFRQWTPDTEANLGREFEIGIMPLQADEFQKGKCGLKLLQYMAAGLPTVATPAGVNCEIVVNGKTGFLPQNESEWARDLCLLLTDKSLRARFGAEGRQRCVRHYSISAWLPVLIEILDENRNSAEATLSHSFAAQSRANAPFDKPKLAPSGRGASLARPKKATSA